MKKVKCFIKDESATHPGKWIVRPVHENFHLGKTTGSYNLIYARLLGLTYAQYLRMCRDCFGAEIIGKGSMYPVAYFKRSKELDALIEFLNVQASAVLWEREHPDFEEHAAYVKEKNPRYYAEVTENVHNS
jgi:hypothetical protein